jgi:hypothetical protein
MKIFFQNLERERDQEFERLNNLLRTREEEIERLTAEKEDLVLNQSSRQTSESEVETLKNCLEEERLRHGRDLDAVAGSLKQQQLVNEELRAELEQTRQTVEAQLKVLAEEAESKSAQGPILQNSITADKFSKKI